MDINGELCCFTPASSINNRALLPCQDRPSAMATWQAWIIVPYGFHVSMTGDQSPIIIDPLFKDLRENISSKVGNNVTRSKIFYYFTHMVLPIATIAIAMGKWRMERIISKKEADRYQLKSNAEHRCNHCSYSCHFQSSYEASLIPVTLVAPDVLFSKAINTFKFTKYCLIASFKLLNKHPICRLEIVVLPRCFASLGFASPNLIFLSKSILNDDSSSHIRLAHEISHSWFGINIGPKDWKEEWLSEGFATFLEDIIYAVAAEEEKEEKKMTRNEETEVEDELKTKEMKTTKEDEIGEKEKRMLEKEDQLINKSGEWVKRKNETNSSYPRYELEKVLKKYSDLFLLRAHIRFITLLSEQENSDEALQVLSPSNGDKSNDLGSVVDVVANGDKSRDLGSEVDVVVNGLNVSKPFLQVHYLKGYFLLHYFSQMVSLVSFINFLQDFVISFHGKLVTSEDFLDMLFKCFPVIETLVTKTNILSQWLRSPVINCNIEKMFGSISDSNVLVKTINKHYDHWISFDEKAFKRKSNIGISKCPKTLDLITEYKFTYSDQLVLVLEKLLKKEKLKLSTLKEIHSFYKIPSRNCDIRHRWCELAIKHNFSDLKDIKTFLYEDQCMGVYLFGELMISNNKKYKKFARDTFKSLENELDESSRQVISDMLFG